MPSTTRFPCILAVTDGIRPSSRARLIREISAEFSITEVIAMDELVALVAQKTGLSPEQARSATETVLGFLKSKLPEPLAGQIDSLVTGHGSGGVADVVKGVGELLGKS